MERSQGTGLYRWAPTPSGPLHLGNVFSILLTQLLARAARAQILLRIDDLDATRARPEHVREIFQVLGLLGLEWQQGPRDADDFFANYSQALFQEMYRSDFDRLRARRPELFFVCECTRSEILAQNPDGLYPGTCRTKALDWMPGRVWRCRVPTGENVAWDDMLRGRVKIDLSARMGDFVVFRKEGLFSYQWVSLCEDIRYGVTDIVRGEDLKTSTAAQIFLGEGTDFASRRFAHHPLLLDGPRKLSKSEGALAVSKLLADGARGRMRVLQSFARWCGLEGGHHVCAVSDLYRLHDLQKGVFNFGRNAQIHELL